MTDLNEYLTDPRCVLVKIPWIEFDPTYPCNVGKKYFVLKSNFDHCRRTTDVPRIKIGRDPR